VSTSNLGQYLGHGNGRRGDKHMLELINVGKQGRHPIGTKSRSSRFGLFAAADIHQYVMASLLKSMV